MRPVERVKVPCCGCGTELEKYPSQVAQSKTGRFICPECKRTGRAGTKPRTVPRSRCEWCSGEFVAYTKREGAGRFCSKACYDAWQGRHRVERICQQCGKSFTRPPSWETRQAARFCSRPCEAKSRIKRPVGREHNGKPAIYDRQGYVRVYEPNHPRAMNGGWVFEHRLIAEARIGRFLRQDEHVHHVNGQKGDNRPENLVVMGHSEHSTLTVRERGEALAAQTAELAEYRRRFGPL